MLVWQTFLPVPKSAFGYFLVMDTTGVRMGGIHTLGNYS